MGKSRSIIKQSLERFDSLMAIGASRFDAKQSARQSSPTPFWSFTTGQIHSYTTRKVYQQQVLRFVTWAREVHGIRKLDELDAQAANLATTYLRERVRDAQSPHTLAVERAALRMFFSNRSLCDTVVLPRRTRSSISRSRSVAVRDKDFQPANHQVLIQFLRVTGLRRSEARDLRTGDVHRTGPDTAIVIVRNGKGGKAREVPVLSGYADFVVSVATAVKEGERLFRIPSHLDVHALRRDFAQHYYMQLSGRDLPPAAGRLPVNSYDKAAIYLVSRALGHNRLDVVLRHYIR